MAKSYLEIVKYMVEAKFNIDGVVDKPDEEHYMKLVEWERNSGSRTYVAWRMSGEEWLFVSIGEFTKREVSEKAA